MATKQLRRVDISEFKFKNPQVSVKSGMEYMKKLTVVAASSILYLRDVFPSNTFADRRIEEMKIKVLRALDEVPGSRTMMEWIKSAFTALECHFLKKMVIVIEKGDETAIEAYTFCFDYNRDMIICSTADEPEKIEPSQEVPQDIKRATKQLIRTILMTTQHMEVLPDDAKISMRLEFNDFVPEDYELPKHFKATDSLGIKFPHKPQTLKIGKVDTKFTSLAMKSHYIEGDNRDASSEEEEDNDMVVSSQPPEPHTNLSFTGTSLRGTPLDNQDLEREASHLSETLSSVRLRGVVKCICDGNDVAHDNLQCAVCCTNQHRACYKIVEGQTVGRHVCVDCHDANNTARTCTDPRLVGDQNRKEGALYRRALALCLAMPSVSPNTFMSQLNTSRQAAQQIYNRLDIDGCLHPAAGRRKTRSVNTENIRENILNLHFNLPVKDGVAEMDTEENLVTEISELSCENKRKRLFVMDEGKENRSPDKPEKRMKYIETKKHNVRK